MGKFAVIGYPVSHSLSPHIHHAFAKQTQRDVVYAKIETTQDDFEKTVRSFFSKGGKGCNLTAPFKEQAFSLAQHHSDAANQAQAANTLTLLPDGSLSADNTDGVGLIKDLIHNHRIKLAESRLLIIGAGGATRGLLGPLLEKRPASIIITNRTFKRAADLAKQFQQYGPVSAVALNELSPKTGPFDLMIHATSAGLHGIKPTLPASLIDPHTPCYDLSYGAAAKPFLDWATQHGATEAFSGLGMLVEQAAAAFRIWHGVLPDTKTVLEKLQTETSNKA